MDEIADLDVDIALSLNSAKNKRKIRATEKRVIQRRKHEKAVTETFNKIDELLKLTPDPQETASSQQIDTQTLVDVEDEIPKNAPGYKFLDLELFGRLFSENALKLTDFVDPERLLYGHAAKTVNVDLFRKLAIARCFNLLPEPLDEGVARFALHLLACTENPEAILACFEYLELHPVAVTSEEYLPLLLNLGITAPELEPVKTPDYLTTKKTGRASIPFMNLRYLMQYLIICVGNGRFSCDASAEPVVMLLSKLGLDERIRASPVLAYVVDGLSSVVEKCVGNVGPMVVCDWLLAPHDHPLNQLEVSSLLIRPHPEIQRPLLLSTLKRVIGPDLADLLGTKPRIEPRDFRVVIRHVKEMHGRHLQVYTALHLLITAAPVVKMTPDEYEATRKLLMSFKMENKRHSDVRLRSAVTKLLSILMLAEKTVPSSTM